jgi:membrane protease subunit HflC
MNPIKTLALIATLFVLMIVYASAYTVNEGQQALLLRLGNIQTDSATGKAYIKGPGLHFKMPFLMQAKIFDTRLQTLDIKSSRIMTAEQKDVLVDYYVKWRISNLALYYTRTGGNPRQADLLLEQQINDSLRAEFGRRKINEVISDDRVNIMDTLNKQANSNAQKLGLDVIDVRIKRIDLPTEVSTAVFDRMRAERERVATEHRSTGKANAEAIRAKADANVTIMIATAKEEAAKIRSEGDALAAKIYSEAYDKNPKFFAFYRSLDAYRKVFDKNNPNNILVLKPDNQFFKYFNGNNEKDNSKN